MSADAGRLIAVVGPSGVGKDTLITASRVHLVDRDDIVFARRTITRPAGADAEAHRPVTPEAFEQMRDNGDFCFWWEAHGLRYGLSSTLRADLAGGCHVVVNGSRRCLEALHAVFPNLAIISITADAKVIARRLAARGREDASEIATRLSRSAPIPAIAPIIEIDNSVDLATAAKRFAGSVETLIGRSS